MILRGDGKSNLENQDFLAQNSSKPAFAASRSLAPEAATASTIWLPSPTNSAFLATKNGVVQVVQIGHGVVSVENGLEHGEKHDEKNHEQNAAAGEFYVDSRTELIWTSPWELLVATILSAQCTDARINQITPDFEHFTDRAHREIGRAHV